MTIDETGLEIQIAVRPQDVREFETKAKELFRHFSPPPKTNIRLEYAPRGTELPGLGYVDDVSDDYNLRGKWTAIMGCVPYRVNLQQLKNLSPHARNLGGTLLFDIGELQVAASREELKYGDLTQANLSKRIGETIDAYVAKLLDGIEKLSQWERRLRIRLIERMSLPVPKEWAKLPER